MSIKQEEFMWRLMLQHERCVCGQLLAVDNLKTFASNTSWNFLQKCVEDEDQFWRVRDAAALAMPIVHNTQHLNPEQANTGLLTQIAPLSHEALITQYKRRYYLQEFNDIPKQNRFQRNIPDYWVQQAETM